MQSKMILETRNGKTFSVGLECLFFIVLFIIVNSIQGIFVIIPMFIEIAKTNFIEMLASGQVVFDDIYGMYISLMSSPSVVIVMLYSFAVFIIGVVFYCKKIQKRSYISMGFVKEGAVSKYLVGMLLGAAMLVVIYAIFYILGVAGSISYGGFDYFIPLFFFGFLIQSTAEEVLMRGYFMNSIAARSNIPLAVILNSAFFMILHILNPGVTLISTANIFLIGLVFSVLFLLTENIWLVSGIHFFWNFASGCLLGSNVSGMQTKSVLHIPLVGSDFLAGGDFGVEGSIVTTIVGIVFLAVLTVFYIKRERKSPGLLGND